MNTENAFFIQFAEKHRINVGYYILPILGCIIAFATIILCVVLCDDKECLDISIFLDADISFFLGVRKLEACIGFTMSAIVLLGTIVQRHIKCSSISNVIMIILGIVPCVSMCLVAFFDNEIQPIHINSAYACFGGFILYQLTHTIFSAINLCVHVSESAKMQKNHIKAIRKCNIISTVVGFLTSIMTALFFTLWIMLENSLFEWLAVSTTFLFFLHYPVLYAIIRKQSSDY